MMEFSDKLYKAKRELVEQKPTPLSSLGKWGDTQTLNFNIQRKMLVENGKGKPKKIKWEEHWNTDPTTAYYNFSGLYAFWWTGPKDIIENAQIAHLNQGKQYTNEDDKRYKLLPEGRNKAPFKKIDGLKKEHLLHPMNFEFNWSEESGSRQLPKASLYIGKSSGVFDRVKSHLKWHENFTVLKKNQKRACPGTLPRHTGRQQFRVGFEYLFQHVSRELRRKYLKEYVGLTVLPTAADEVAFRFYAEDYLIGHQRPSFNVDSER